jgi:hypothetical protein
MDDAAITVWNGERFLAYERWLATAPVVREGKSPGQIVDATPATCVAGDCGGIRIWLVKAGERWLMYARSRKGSSRRKDFASPFLEHAIRTAEQWYGVPPGGWRPEMTRNEKDVRKTARVPPQDHDLAEEACG